MPLPERTYRVQAHYHATVCYSTEFSVQAGSKRQAVKLAERLLQESCGKDRPPVVWEVRGDEGDGDYHIDVGDADESAGATIGQLTPPLMQPNELLHRILVSFQQGQITVHPGAGSIIADIKQALANTQ